MAEFKPVTLENWGGLNLRDDAAHVGLDGAVDLLNVAFDRRGRVRTRDGYSKFTAVAAADFVTGMSPFNTASFLQLVVCTQSQTRALDNTGALIASTGTGAFPATFVRFGTPTTEYLYIANGNTQVMRWDGAAFTSPAGLATQTGRHLGVTPSDNRLVVAGTTTNPSRVAFSDPGAPETFGASNWVDLTPGDGETIVGVATWRDSLIVFKESKFFVFYGTSTDSAGGPVFNYRPVVCGVGPQTTVVCAGRDGVYFAHRTQGIFRTTGGQPERVSGPIDPLFLGGITPEFFGLSRVFSVKSLAFCNDTLYAAIDTNGSYYTLTYDTVSRQWSVWDIPALGLGVWSKNAITARDRVYFGYGSGTKDVGEISESVTTDAGAAITSRYRTGFFAPAGPTVPATIREVLLEGSGTVTVKGSTDYGSLGTGTSVALGTSPAVAQGRKLVAQMGRQHSYDFSATTAWTLNRATFHVESKGTVGKQP